MFIQSGTRLFQSHGYTSWSSSPMVIRTKKTFKFPSAPSNSKIEGTLTSSKEDPFAKELKILHNLTPGCTISWMIYYICYIDKCIPADTYITNT